MAERWLFIGRMLNLYRWLTDLLTMPYNFYIQVVFIKEDRLSIGHAVPKI